MLPEVRSLDWRAAIVLIAALLISTTGCYQRTNAPAITYDQAEVDLLDKEIKKLDWEY